MTSSTQGTAAGERREARRDAILLGTLFGLAGLGSSSASVALAAVAAEFGISVGVATWTISGYALLLAVTTAVYGRVADLVGVRGPLLVGIALMAAGAVAAAVAPSFAVLVLARLVQGAGAAAVPTLGITVISQRYTGVVRGEALGWLSALAALVSALGPLIGGMVETWMGWRGVMALPLLGVLTLPLLWPALAGGGTGARLDVLGAVFVALAAAGAVFLVQSPSTGPAVAVTGAVLLIVGIPLVRGRVRRYPHGFLPRAVIRNGRVVRAALASAAAPTCWFALLVAVPAVLVEEGWSTWQVGLLMVPGALVSLTLPFWVGQLIERIGGARAIAWATVVSGAALVIAAIGLAQVWPVLIALATVVLSLGFGLGQPARVATVGDAVEPDVRGVALGVTTLVFLVGASVGSAAIGGLGGSLGIPLSVLALVVVPVLGLIAIRVDVRASNDHPTRHS